MKLRIPLKLSILRVLLFFIVMSGVLMNTSLINISNFGIPVFYALIPMMFAWVLLRNSKSYPVTISPYDLRFVLTMLLILLTVVFLHCLLGVGDPFSELKQLMAKSAFVVFYLISTIALACRKPREGYIWLKFFLKCAIGYGLYQFVAGIFHLPLPLNFLRNSASFLIEDPTEALGPGGWLNTFRIFSIWTEPSFSALPLGMMLFLLAFHPKGKREVVCWGALTVVYAVLTFSRLAWIVVATTLCALGVLRLLERTERKRLLRFVRDYKMVLFLAFITISIGWVNIAPLLMNDLSSAGRSSSVIVGLRIFGQHPWLGTGMNSFQFVESLYVKGISFYNPEPTVHNAFVSYAQQMGFLGLAFTIIPIVYILYLVKVDISQRLVGALIFALTGVFGGDIYYMPLSWLILAMFAASSRHLSIESLDKCSVARISA